METAHPQTTTKPGCIEKAVAIFGDKWSGPLVRELTECPKTFSELESTLPGISPRTLSQRLSKLEQEHILRKELYCEHPPRYKYNLTPKGSELKNILHHMAVWGSKYSNS